MSFEDLLTHRKSQAGSLARGFGGHEKIKDVRQDIRRNAHPCVANFCDQTGLGEILSRANGYLRLRAAANELVSKAISKNTAKRRRALKSKLISWTGNLKK